MTARFTLREPRPYSWLTDGDWRTRARKARIEDGTLWERLAEGKRRD